MPLQTVVWPLRNNNKKRLCFLFQFSQIFNKSWNTTCLFSTFKEWKDQTIVSGLTPKPLTLVHIGINHLDWKKERKEKLSCYSLKERCFNTITIMLHCIPFTCYLLPIKTFLWRIHSPHVQHTCIHTERHSVCHFPWIFKATTHGTIIWWM